MRKTATFLLGSLIIIPLVSLYFAEPLTEIQTQAMLATVKIYAMASLVCFAISEITKNHSQVDKVWSILPIIYVWNMAAIDGFGERALLMATLVTIWGIRLTLNFGRKGGYSWKFWVGEEDYRWSVLQQRDEFKNPWVWRIFNLLFISFYQNGLTLLITYPMVLTLGSSEPLGVMDYVVAGAMLSFIVYETIADNQQWKFHLDKHAFMKETGKSGKEFEGGFNQRGLWALSRHPNYFAEQGVWVVFYLFSVAATGHWFNWSIVGSILLILLFRGSSDFSEDISASKYPEYKNYQKRVPRFIPNPLLLSSGKARLNFN